MNKIPVIIDTDPGIDDAAAIGIALFSQCLDIKLITTVFGNVSVEKTTSNALKLLNFYKKQTIRIAKGAAEPLLIDAIDASGVHGDSGMEGYDFIEGDVSLLCENNAVVEMRKVLIQSEKPITIVAIGPLTNIALLLKTFPEVKHYIKEVIFMGGSYTRGNYGVMSEFNFHADPHAADIVLKSGINLVMAPLDIGLKALITPEVIAQIEDMNETGRMLSCLFRRYRGGSYATGLKMYDSTAIGYLLCPEMYTKQFVYVTVETCGAYTLGSSLVDFKGYLNHSENVTVLTDIDSSQFKLWFVENLKKCI